MKNHNFVSINELVEKLNFFGTSHYEVHDADVFGSVGFTLSIDGKEGSLIYSEERMKERLSEDLYYLL